ncbi:MAG: hypothetical protein KDC04_01760 [Saprospiraceae bacterium]|nr:hypothetical protein [Saprospiraceae bacterium]MCB9310700.1 XRE family transcriptional regulator [Lewinellaceae bacterium]
MNLFGSYLKDRRAQLRLPSSKVATKLEIGTSILSKIDIIERMKPKEILLKPVVTFDVRKKKIQIELVQWTILSELGDLEFLTAGLKNVLKKI